MTSLLDSLTRPISRWRLARARAVVAQILANGSWCSTLDSGSLLDRSLALRYRAQCGEELERLLVEAYALVREAARRAIGQTHFDVQLLGGVLLHRRAIAEMQTGEGKTLTATLPLYLHSLSGRGVHLATANDYLARRDADWMRPVFEALGLSVGVILAGQTAAQRRAAYHCDVTYGTAREFGFDFLRDRLRAREAAEDQLLFAGGNLADNSSAAPSVVQRGLNFVLVDEADSLLIDEARIPLIISAATTTSPGAQSAMLRWTCDRARGLIEREQFVVDLEKRKVELTAAGREAVRSAAKPVELSGFGLPELYESVERALRVERFFIRDRHYVVFDGAVIIVDEFTGRPSEGRQWRDGVHQAVQAREGLPISSPTVAAAQITVQELFTQYSALAGMTGTAVTSASEFRAVYGLHVAQIPTHRPPQRVRLPDRVLRDAPAKWLAIVDEVGRMQQQRRPVLIGTRSIDKSEELSRHLTGAGVPHRVLHARNLAAEADIVSQAGRSGCVTVATNMAGRGTDIELGPGVAELGGMHVVCSELHDAARIDRQLIGRSGRQGDPGSYRQFLSLDDEILTSGLGADRAAKLRRSRTTAVGSLDDLTGWFYLAQRRVERRHRSDRQLLMHQAAQRKLLHERMGQDPWLDAQS